MHGRRAHAGKIKAGPQHGRRLDHSRTQRPPARAGFKNALATLFAPVLAARRGLPRMTSTKRPRDDPFDAGPRDARPRGADAERSFECRVCRARHRFDYFGRRPPWCATVTFLEDAYVMRDPFVAPPRDRKSARSPLCLGAPCRLCGRAVCSLPSCSLFYAVRMCRTCLTPAVVRQLPAQVACRSIC